MRDTPAAAGGVPLWTRSRTIRVRLATPIVVGTIAVSAGTGCKDAPRTPRGTQAALQESDRLREQLRILGRTEEQEGVQQLRRKAELGHADAQYSLGVSYREGKGVDRDRVEAYKWMSLAAALEESAAVRDRLAQQMTPAQIAEAERRAREWTAAFEKRKK